MEEQTLNAPDASDMIAELEQLDRPQLVMLIGWLANGDISLALEGCRAITGLGSRCSD